MGSIKIVSKNPADFFAGSVDRVSLIAVVALNINRE